MTNKFKIMALLSVVSYGSLLPVHVFVENRVGKQVTIRYSIKGVKEKSLQVGLNQEVYLGDMDDIITISAEAGNQALYQQAIQSARLKECWSKDIKVKPQGANAILFPITLWNSRSPDGDLSFGCGRAGYYAASMLGAGQPKFVEEQGPIPTGGTELLAEQSKGPTFELTNKDKETVRITEFKVYGGTIVHQDFASNTLIHPAQGGTVHAARAQIRVEDANDFLIYLKVFRPNQGESEFSIRPGRKTVFVSFNSAKRPALYPQEVMGYTGLLALTEITNKGDTGLSLKNNLSSSDIKEGDSRSTWQKMVK